MLWQLLNGVHYLHTNWVLHRDLKPANIMVTSTGQIRIGDLGLARIFHKPLNSLFSGDKVVVTIWYRAPELLLGAKHYTPAIDLWAVGCIFAELLSLRPIFKGEEAKLDNKKTPPFQRNQMQKIVEVLGMPRKEHWPGLVHHFEYTQLQTLSASAREAPRSASNANNNNNNNNNSNSNSNSGSGNSGGTTIPPGLESWYNNTLASTGYPNSPPSATPGPEGLDLLAKLLEYDPQKRLTAKQAMGHPYFLSEGDPAAVAGIVPEQPAAAANKVSTPGSGGGGVGIRPGTVKDIKTGGGGVRKGIGAGGTASVAMTATTAPTTVRSSTSTGTNIGVNNRSMAPPPPPPAPPAPISLANVFHGLMTTYPSRRVSQDESDIRSASLPGTKRTGMAAGMAGPDDWVGGRGKKRGRE